MLKGIPQIISPELLKILAEMGHGDEIVICDANCPGYRVNEKCVRCDVVNASEVLDAVLRLMPLDTYEHPLFLMEKVPGDENVKTAWGEYNKIVGKYTDIEFKHIERFAFYERMKAAYAVVITADNRAYGNIIIKKGVI